MNTVKIKSYAKVNLTLDVTGRAGGYHLLDSFVASVDLFDLVCVRKRKDKLVSVTMHGMDGEGIPPKGTTRLRRAKRLSGAFPPRART